jgi:hypothetical protein
LEICPGSHSDDASFGLSCAFGSTHDRPSPVLRARSVPNTRSGALAQNVDNLAQRNDNLAQRNDNLVNCFFFRRAPCGGECLAHAMLYRRTPFIIIEARVQLL